MLFKPLTAIHRADEYGFVRNKGIHLQSLTFVDLTKKARPKGTGFPDKVETS
jgi:hypothetical protein